jgi:type I restriction enzyme R subunit
LPVISSSWFGSNGRQYQLITNDDRLDKIAQDLVPHFSSRGYRGKAMFIAIDKAPAVRMHDKVKRIVKENLDEKFKADDDPLRLVFVCAMWITGFDVPTCSTMYLDKPMKNHTLMQTIARANRVSPGKEAGLIVDYVGVFRNLKDALAIYARPRPGANS